MRHHTQTFVILYKVYVSSYFSSLTVLVNVYVYCCTKLCAHSVIYSLCVCVYVCVCVCVCVCVSEWVVCVYVTFLSHTHSHSALSIALPFSKHVKQALAHRMYSNPSLGCIH